MGKTWGKKIINGHKILAGKPEMKRSLGSHDPLWEDIYYIRVIRSEKFYIPQSKITGYILQRQKCAEYFPQIEEDLLQHKCIYGIKASI